MVSQMCLADLRIGFSFLALQAPENFTGRTTATALPSPTKVGQKGFTCRMDLRPYQEDVVEKLRKKIREGKRRLVLVAATGSGKTVCASHLIQNAVKKKKKALFIAHRKELIDQASSKLDEFGIDHGIIKSKHKRNRPWELVQVCSAQTLVRRKHVEADLVIIDEAHRSPASTYQKILQRFSKPPVIIGATATPYRSDGRGLGDCYDDLACAISTAELVEQGYLIEPTVYAASNIDLSKVKIKMGDFEAGSLSDAMADIVLRGEIVDNWKSKANDACTVAFCVNVEHSKELCRQFLKAGVKAAHLDGKTPDKEREATLRMLANREIQVVCSVGVLTEGWDLPKLECIILARPTQSRGLFKQMVGRIMRPDDDKRFAYVFDHAGCTRMHGFVTDKEQYDLNSQKRKGRVVSKVPSLDLQTICVGCSAFITLRADKCPHCGEANRREELNIAETDQELEVVKPKKPIRRPSKRHQEAYNKLCRTCIERSNKPGWVRMQFRDEIGHFPPGNLQPTPEFQQYIRRFLDNESKKAQPKRSENLFSSARAQAWDF